MGRGRGTPLFAADGRLYVDTVETVLNIWNVLAFHWPEVLGGLLAIFLIPVLAGIVRVWRRPREPTALEAIRGGAQAALVLLLLASLTFPAFEALGITAVMGVLAALAFAPREAAA